MSITYIILGITCLLSFLCFNDQGLFNRLAHHPYREARTNEKYRWITNGFIHADITHLMVNMFTFYFFGPVVEQKFKEVHGTTAGSVMFVLFYVFMILMSSLPTYLKHRDNPGYRAIGASGAIAAILFSFIVFKPTGLMYVYLFFPLPAILFGVLYLVYESWAAKKGGDNIGHDAHLYGAVFGFIFTIIMKPALLGEFLFKIKQGIESLL